MPTNRRRLLVLIPLLLLLALIGLFWQHLDRDPHQLPSALLNRPAPDFDLPSLYQSKPFNKQRLLGQVSLLNVWASWCYTCRQEHPILMAIARTPGVNLYSINYKDKPEQAKQWLATFGNPFQQTGVDQSGKTAINWGVYGTPETYVIDKQGIIRYKHVGEITPDVWHRILQPLIQKLNQA